ATHALARAASLSMLTATPAATDEGLGALYAARAGRKRVWVAMAAGLAITLASVGPVLLPVAVLLASFGAAGVTRVGSRRVGGIARAPETALLRSAAAAGVPVPAIVAEDDEHVVVARIAGETIPRKILRDEEFAAARPLLAGQCGEALARIHAIPVDAVPGLE